MLCVNFTAAQSIDAIVPTYRPSPPLKDPPLVDFTTASRAADGKRKRNAEVSAHFRKRRKEIRHQNNSAVQRPEQEPYEATNKANDLRQQRGEECSFPRPHPPCRKRELLHHQAPG